MIVSGVWQPEVMRNGANASGVGGLGGVNGSWIDGQHRAGAVLRSEPSEALGQFGLGRRMLGTGTGKTAAYLGVVLEALRRGERLTLVVKDRAEVLETRALFEEALRRPLPDWLKRPNQPSPGGLRPLPCASRKLRARVSHAAEYRALCRRVEEREAAGRDQERRVAVREHRVRYLGAKRAVELRADGRCENPSCLLPDLPYRTRSGGFLLDVDHVDDHARGGRDHPSAMIALCPNCHTYKTRGGDRDLVERLRTAAATRHEEWMRREL